MNMFSAKVTYDLKYSLGPTKQKKGNTPRRENQYFIACLVAIVPGVLGLPYKFTLAEINYYKQYKDLIGLLYNLSSNMFKKLIYRNPMFNKLKTRFIPLVQKTKVQDPNNATRPRRIGKGVILSNQLVVIFLLLNSYFVWASLFIIKILQNTPQLLISFARQTLTLFIRVVDIGVFDSLDKVYVSDE